MLLLCGVGARLVRLLSLRWFAPHAATRIVYCSGILFKYLIPIVLLSFWSVRHVIPKTEVGFVLFVFDDFKHMIARKS